MSKKFAIFSLIVFMLGVTVTVLYFGCASGEMSLFEGIVVIVVVFIGAICLIGIIPQRLSSDSSGSYIFNAFRSFDLSIDKWNEQEGLNSTEAYGACSYLYDSILNTVRYQLKIKDIEFDKDAPLFEIMILLPKEIRDSKWYNGILKYRDELIAWSRIYTVFDYIVNEQMYDELCDLQADKLHGFEDD